ncbi:MAG: hypothetical protein GXP47_03795 [Acidobacteria bacterium]|nr:hypothetical protein [Acidobacteriota bacterium]
MAERCPTGFDERLLTAYLDAELTQDDEQRVEIHVEDCAHCAALLDELRRLREAAMNTTFATPPDEQWNETPRTAGSGALRRLGWWIAIPWILVLGSYALYEAWQGAAGALERVLVFGGISAVVLLFLSVLLDRLRDAQGDRYREVKK